MKEGYKLPKDFFEKEKAALVKIESGLIDGAVNYLRKNAFTQVIPPHLTRATGACENIDTMFEVDYFGNKSFLSQTGQLYLESFISELGNVYCIGPSFRKEPSADARHLTEFTLIELEFPTKNGLEELMTHVEGIVSSMINNVVENNHEDLQTVNANIERLENLTVPFEKITYNKALNILNNNGSSMKWGSDLKNKHELFITEHSGKKPVFITHYPQEMKFFNMEPNEENPKIVNSTDLILPDAGEAVGAACRIYKPDQLINRLDASSMMGQLRKKGVEMDAFSWYEDVVAKHGMPHAGFGMGLGRVMKYVTGAEDIRDCTAFPINAAVIY
ncbi:MAG: hypothetical protein JSW73_00930 [Candidatus Woesearchaeota archaeon]|nr:MAG: hypothetical protein JSW73_00930 [Candidatus Woesearchaeota archaeon]